MTAGGTTDGTDTRQEGVGHISSSAPLSIDRIFYCRCCAPAATDADLNHIVTRQAAWLLGLRCAACGDELASYAPVPNSPVLVYEAKEVSFDHGERCAVRLVLHRRDGWCEQAEVDVRILSGKEPESPEEWYRPSEIYGSVQERYMALTGALDDMARRLYAQKALGQRGGPHHDTP